MLLKLSRETKEIKHFWAPTPGHLNFFCPGSGAFASSFSKNANSNLQILFIIKLLITEIRIIQVPFSGALFYFSIVQGIFAP